VNRITREEIRTYQDDGVVCVRRLLDDSWIARMRRAVDRVTDNPGPMRESYSPEQPGRFFSEKFLWTVDPDFRAFVYESPVAAAVGRLMGATKINLFYDHLLVKEPGTEAPTHWHQDSNFWPFQGAQICSVWFPLDAVDLSNGALEFVRGSHAWYDRPMSRQALFGNRDGQPQDAGDDGAMRVDDTPEQPNIEAHREDFDIVSWDLDPGDALIFTALTLHFAPPNLTAGRRRALSTRWLGDDVRYRRKAKMLQLIRDPGLADGQPPDCELFPVIWRQAA
jgi:ectoine hydroxylase-related dioxygenase (phytanoyl-CoA dioxygenase family)